MTVLLNRNLKRNHTPAVASCNDLSISIRDQFYAEDTE